LRKAFKYKEKQVKRVNKKSKKRLTFEACFDKVLNVLLKEATLIKNYKKFLKKSLKNY